jgi:hypothetical protein
MVLFYFLPCVVSLTNYENWVAEVKRLGTAWRHVKKTLTYCEWRPGTQQSMTRHRGKDLPLLGIISVGKPSVNLGINIFTLALLLPSPNVVSVAIRSLSLPLVSVCVLSTRFLQEGNKVIYFSLYGVFRPFRPSSGVTFINRPLLLLHTSTYRIFFAVFRTKVLVHKIFNHHSLCHETIMFKDRFCDCKLILKDNCYLSQERSRE